MMGNGKSMVDELALWLGGCIYCIRTPLMWGQNEWGKKKKKKKRRKKKVVGAQIKLYMKKKN
jgi:hypothetical protein